MSPETNFIPVKKSRVKPWITAHAIVREQGRVVTNTIRVPVNLKGSIPTVPYIIQFEKDYYVKTSTNPLEYTSASFGKVVKYERTDGQRFSG